MRVQVYNEELVPVDVELVRQTAQNTGTDYLGMRIWLVSPAELHSAEEGDDDRSAVTFWAPDSEEGLLLLEEVGHSWMLLVQEAKEQGRG